MPTPSKQEYVYLIGSRKFGWYKIGKAKQPSVRIAQLGILLPFQVMVFGIWSTSQGLQTERRMHDRYSHLSINGEWFSFTIETVVSLLRETHCPLSAVVYSLFDPKTYVEAQNIGIRTDFSNVEKDITIVASGMSKARRKLRLDHWTGWLAERGLEYCPENCQIHHKEINDAWKAKYDGISKEQLAVLGGFNV